MFLCILMIYFKEAIPQKCVKQASSQHKKCTKSKPTAIKPFKNAIMPYIFFVWSVVDREEYLQPRI